MEYSIDASGAKKHIHPPRTQFSGVSPKGETLDFTNYYMRLGGRPFYAMCGEMHFSRVEERFWEDEIIKMKMSGLNIISTYIFWIHHEEEKGVYDWSGNKNLRKFARLCAKHGMFLVLRVGPFVHGECRNGGFPDWMYGTPFDIRSNDPEYIAYTRRFFNEIGKQVTGLMYKDGGAIVGTQIENEYEHASAPWEVTTENSSEWIPGGNDGPAHMRLLKELAISAGIVTPFYSATAWGGACAPPDDVFPLWGGYAFWPWIFYGDIKEHPATTEFIFKDFHNNMAPKYYNFDPEYNPEDMPFACCEMGGGMACFYKYRFLLPYESVEAMAEVKAASGCNFLGYYMFHGGTNPKGKRVPYLNECALPKMSYDYQAAVGEYGQLRPSYKRLKLQQYFYKDFEELFCATRTVLSNESVGMDQHDADTLRYCVRANGDHGFLFLNTYQDHIQTKHQTDFAVHVTLGHETIRVPRKGGLSLNRDACAILPLNLTLDGIRVKYASVQLITRLENDDCPAYFFFVPEGMSPELMLEGGTVSAAETDGVATELLDDKLILITLPEQSSSVTTLTNAQGKKIVFHVLSRPDSLRFWRVRHGGKDLAILCDEALLDDCGALRVESIGAETGRIGVFPKPKGGIAVDGKPCACEESVGGFAFYSVVYGKNTVSLSWRDASARQKQSGGELKRPVLGSPITSSKIRNARAMIELGPESFINVKQVLVQVDYFGDIGYAYLDGDLISDNFCNGAIWEFGLKAHESEVLRKGIYLYVSPKREGGYIKSDSEMAARFAVYEDQFAVINDIRAVPVFDCALKIGL